MRANRWWRLLTPLLLIVLAWVVVTNWQSVVEAFAVAGASLFVVVPLGIIGLVSGAASWAVLQPSERRRRAFGAFLVAQPAKYLPGGGFIQAASQVTMSTDRGVSAGPTSVSFGVHALVQVAAGASVALLVAVQSQGWSALVVAGGVALVPMFLVLFNDPMSGRLMGFLKRFERLRLEHGGLATSARARYASWGLTTIPLAAAGGIFYIMVGGVFDPRDLAYTVGAFAAAWVAGFLFFLIPVGLGIRESVLVLLLADVPASQLIAVSAAHRALMLVIEAVVAFAVHLYQRPKTDSGTVSTDGGWAGTTDR